MDECFFIIQPLFWKLTLMLVIIKIISFGIALIYKSLTGYSWYGIGKYTLIGWIIGFINIIFIAFPLAFLIDFIHLIIKWIF